MNAITARIRSKKDGYAINSVWLPRVCANASTVDVHDMRTDSVIQLTPDEACRLAWKLLEAAAQLDGAKLMRGTRR